MSAPELPPVFLSIVYDRQLLHSTSPHAVSITLDRSYLDRRALPQLIGALQRAHQAINDHPEQAYQKNVYIFH
jgi:hypothetical protein